jgi:hypothetical protein
MSSAAWARLVLSVLTRGERSALWRRTVESFGTVAVPDEWSIVLVLHCSRIVSTCLHALQALTTLPARMSYRSMLALTSGALKTCACALGTCVSSCTGRSAKLFFMLEAHGPQGAAGHVVVPEPTLAGSRGPSHRICGSAEAHLNWEARFGAVGHVAASEPTSVRR